MSAYSVSVVILAAGFGTRMRSSKPKVLHEIGGLPMLGHVMAGASALSPQSYSVVIGDHSPQVGDYASSVEAKANIFIQSPPQGTGDAVRQAMPALKDADGIVLALFADTPLVSPQTLEKMAQTVAAGAAVTVLGFEPAEPGRYGRLVTNETGELDAIVEAADASPEQLEIRLCNSGVMAFDAAFLRTRIGEITNNNAKDEYYLTDLVAIARKHGEPCAFVACEADEVLGVNSRNDLAKAEAAFQTTMREKVMTEGATLLDPTSIYFSYDTVIGKDVTIGQHVVFGPGVTVSDNAAIHPYSHLEGASVMAGATVGPYARLRPGTEIGEGAKIGNFVEVKKAAIQDGAKVNHLSYIGDAQIGRAANIGAGTITCNYDGFSKHKTTIGDGAFIGSNSSLVAPVSIGDGAYVGSGSVITKNVDANALAVARGRQAVIKGWASRFRDAKTSKTSK